MANLYDAVIVGAGHNGLVVAAYLARAGKKVLVLERREIAGGAAVTEEFYRGFKVSTCADLCGLLLPKVIRDLELRRRGLELVKPDPAVFTPLPGGGQLSIWQDPERTLKEIERHSKADAASYPRFASLVSRLTSFLRPLLARPAPQPDSTKGADLLELLRIGWGLRRLGASDMRQALRLLPMSVADLLNEWFESDALKATLATRGIAGTFLGPRSPGTTAVFLYHHLGEPAWPLTSWGLTRGGMGSVSRALREAAETCGATIRTAAPVSSILVRSGKATGVALTGGEEIAAGLVISSADVRTTFLKLLEPGQLEPHFLNQIRNVKFRGVAAKVNLAVGELPAFSHVPGGGDSRHPAIIQVGPGLDYLERAFDEAKYGRPSARPFLQVVVPTLIDPSLAPPGKHVLSIFAQYAPYQLREGSWRDKRDQLAEAVIDVLSEYAPNIKKAILHRQVLTPLDLEEVYGLPEGNIHHGELSLSQLFFMRPIPGWARYRTPIRNLYLCGAGSHPGGGVSGAPGYNASRQILRDWRSGEIR